MLPTVVALIAPVLENWAASEQLGRVVNQGVIGSRYRAAGGSLEATKMGHLANRMRSLASTGNRRAADR